MKASSPSQLEHCRAVLATAFITSARLRVRVPGNRCDWLYAHLEGGHTLVARVFRNGRISIRSVRLRYGTSDAQVPLTERIVPSGDVELLAHSVASEALRVAKRVCYEAVSA